MGGRPSTAGGPLLPSGLAPAPEDEPAEREAEPERADAEGGCGRDLATRGEVIPAADRLLLLRRQRLAAAALPQRAARTDPEVEVVEDLGSLGSLVQSGIQSIACTGRADPDSPP